jgi:hypothetical protein
MDAVRDADDCVYEDLLLGAATTISGKQNLLDTLRFHPAFAAQDFSVPLMGRIPPITLQVSPPPFLHALALHYRTQGLSTTARWHKCAGSSNGRGRGQHHRY